ncbi:hypothetical protein PG988_005240 [Apiospora saccharicola]
MEKTDRLGDPPLPAGGRPANAASTPLPPAPSQSPPVAKQQQLPRHQTREIRPPPPVAYSAAAAAKGGAASQSPPVEFRGFDFFAKREFNELRTASEAYFAPAAAASARASKRLSRLGPASWLRDPTPPEVPPEGLPPQRGGSPSPWAARMSSRSPP